MWHDYTVRWHRGGAGDQRFESPFGTVRLTSPPYSLPHRFACGHVQSLASTAEETKEKRSVMMTSADWSKFSFTNLMSPRRNSDADRHPNAKRKKKGLLVVSLGDCKVYLHSQATGQIRDITEGNRCARVMFPGRR